TPGFGCPLSLTTGDCAMADNSDTTKPEGAADQRSNRPTTIDLKTSEFKSQTSAPASDASSAPEPAQTDDVPPVNDTSEQSGTTSEAARRTHTGLPWPIIGMAAAAAAVFFVIGFGLSQWLARSVFAPPVIEPAQLAPNPELVARLSKIEGVLSAPRQDNPQLLARIAAAEAAVKTATDLAATREKRSDEIAAIARQASERATAAATAAQ